MINIEHEQCTGKGINIALIDSYIVNEEKFSKYNKTNTNLVNIHAQLCLKSAQILAPNANYLLLNASDKFGVITEEAVILALEQCLKLKPSIIIMSIAFEDISNKFKKTIKKLQQIGTIICSSVDSVVKNSFPSALEGVVSVDELINVGYNDSDIQFIDGVFYINPDLYEKKLSKKGSSFANSFFAGYVAKLLEFNPFITPNSLETFFDGKIKKSNFANKYNSYYVKCNGINLADFSKIVSSNYKYYYDDKEKVFRKLLDNAIVSENLITGVDVVDANDFNIKTSPHLFKDFKSKKIPFKFYGNTFNKTKNNIKFENDYIKYISVPSIYITSYNMNMDKFLIQLHLNKFFKEKNLNLGNLSPNPLSKIFNFKFFNFPQKIIYPDYYYYINELLYKTSKGKDLLIASIPGKLDRFVDFNHRLGDLSHIFFSINNPDLVIVSLSDYVKAQELIRIRDYIKNVIGSKIVFYFSYNSKDDNFYGTSDYNLKLDEKSVNFYCKQIQFITKEKAFSRLDLTNKSFSQYILKLFK